uniref:Si:ch211-191j22.3 n=1 Tax=Oryzias latipes TaxID=8090 RepID=A0A3P9J0Q0_ORYLA
MSSQCLPRHGGKWVLVHVQNNPCDAASCSSLSEEFCLLQVAFLRYLTSQTEEDRRALAVVTGLRVGGELLNRITGQDKVDAYKKACILNIVQFLQQNPRASQAQINAEVQKNVVVFAAQVRALETAPLW